MAKVDDFFSKIGEIPFEDPFEWIPLLEMRHQTFLGFANIEQAKGFVAPKASFSTSRGQEMLRILLFRVIEECVESFQSTERTHLLEEAIDALNYLLSAAMLDPRVFTPESLSNLCHSSWNQVQLQMLWKSRLTTEDLGLISISLSGDLTDSFRNRAWMNNSQAIQFEGNEIMAIALKAVMIKLFSLFTDWSEFYRFYIAKDMVLQFRLNTSY